MKERIKELMQQAGTDTSGKWMGVENAEEFAKLIVRECMDVALQELVSDEEIDKEKDIEDRCYLRGNNGGVVDSVVAIKQHFGVEE